jgi:hypothetical protein
MGVDIYGWIEIQEYSAWHAVVDIGILGHRNYTIFGALFGIRCDLFPAIAADRGIPPDASPTIQQSLGESTGEDGKHGQTWVLWNEIIAADPHELGHGLFLYDRYPDPVTGQNREGVLRIPYDAQLIDRCWKEGDHSYWTVQPNRGEIMNDDPHWQTIFNISAALADRFGIDKVRWVVWFE